MDIKLTSDLIEQMHAETVAAHPRECCGMLLGHGMQISQVCSAQNVHPTPRTHFEIDPQALVDVHRAAREGGFQIIGYYHSHPDGPPQPSSTDAAMATGDYRIWAIIGALGELGFWQDIPGGFEARSYAIA